MHQTAKLDNACGVIACLHAIFNNKQNVEVAGDSVLGRFLLSCEGKTPQVKATILEDFKDF